jgi:rfaE bifunctional protein nucleotidyltransferase chain/domain
MAAFTHAACLQMPVVPGDIKANCIQLKRQLASTRLPEGTLVVLPELWATGFDYPNINELSRQTEAVLIDLQQLAAEQNLWFAGSLPEYREGNHPYNTMYLVGADGVAGRYRKHHLFAFWREDSYFQAGRYPQPISADGEPLGALVCYDLRFSEISRSHVFDGCRLIMLSAQWPAARLDHWQVLVRARAIENQTFVVACNSCGTSGVLDLAGRSLIVDPTGRVLSQAGEQAEIIVGELDWEELAAVRSLFCPGGERPWAREDKNKIADLGLVQQKLTMHREQGSKIVFTNGCFDILHAGHVSYLEQAREYGDCLVIGLNSDRSVRALKGESRPVNNEQERARVLAALGCVDYVVIFDEDTPQKLITTLLPDILVKGADWPEDQIVGAAEVKAAGGQVERIVFEHQVSTTQVINKINNLGEK